MIIPRRKFLTGLSAIIAAPAIVRASSIMPVRGWRDLRYDQDGIEWLSAEMDRALREMLEWKEPIPYSDSGFLVGQKVTIAGGELLTIVAIDRGTQRPPYFRALA